MASSTLSVVPAQLVLTHFSSIYAPLLHDAESRYGKPPWSCLQSDWVYGSFSLVVLVGAMYTRRRSVYVKKSDLNCPSQTISSANCNQQGGGQHACKAEQAGQDCGGWAFEITM